MPEDATKLPEDPLESSRELIRSAAKWLVASLGAIAAALIAGSQLSSIGALQGSSSRLRIAIAGLAAGLAAVLWSIWSVVGLLEPRKTTISELAAEWDKFNPNPRGRLRRLKRWRNRRKHDAIHFLSQNPEFMGGLETAKAIKEAWDKARPGSRLNQINELIERVTSIANYRKLARDFRSVRWRLGVAVVIAAGGIGVFAWAANPKEPEQPPASLRFADLSNANLTNANLVNADLTGADLSGANLAGAQLRDAVIKDAVWEGATCPDGTKAQKPAAITPATCEGHTIP